MSKQNQRRSGCSRTNGGYIISQASSPAFDCPYGGSSFFPLCWDGVCCVGTHCLLPLPVCPQEEFGSWVAFPSSTWMRRAMRISSLPSLLQNEQIQCSPAPLVNQVQQPPYYLVASLDSLQDVDTAFVCWGAPSRAQCLRCAGWRMLVSSSKLVCVYADKNRNKLMS